MERLVCPVCKQTDALHLGKGLYYCFRCDISFERTGKDSAHIQGSQIEHLRFPFPRRGGKHQRLLNLLESGVVDHALMQEVGTDDPDELLSYIRRK